ncbi:hypothetical protein Tco_0791634 [Tanacetum coccineum]
MGSDPHHPRSDGIPMSIPIVAPQGLAILLTDAATQAETTKDEASPWLIRSKSLPPIVLTRSVRVFPYVPNVLGTRSIRIQNP